MSVSARLSTSTAAILAAWSLGASGAAVPPFQPAPTGSSSYMIAIDLNLPSLLWKVNIHPALGTDNTPVQFPIVLDPGGKLVLVISGRTSGAYLIAEP